MKPVVLIFLVWLGCGRVLAQQIQTIVPKQAVVVGNAFQVQYILTKPADLVKIYPPDFDSFQLVAGPAYYKGTARIDGKLQSIENITYTLVPLQTGYLKLKGLKARYADSVFKESNATFIQVLAKPKASYNSKSSYTDVSLYAPGSKDDLQNLIDKNLFIKVTADKKFCYAGEAVVVSFKLFSRLQSASEAEKSPGFYGFSVVDMLDINQAHTAVTRLNGQIFNTAILRQVQLFPMQAGTFTIDEMYVKNEIEFDGKNGKTTIEKEIISKPITIQVKALPAPRPKMFTGAVGKFAIEAHLEKDSIEVNEQNKLIVTLTGKGNFIQLEQPQISWPKGFEVFDAIITDQLKKNVAPIEGKRMYVFEFTADSSGVYSIPAIVFSFFDPQAAIYKKGATGVLKIKVMPANKIPALEKIRTEKSHGYFWFITITILAVLLFFSIYKLRRATVAEKQTEKKKAKWLQQAEAIDTAALTDKETCMEIQKILTGFAKTTPLTTQQREEMEGISKDCQLQIYSETTPEQSKQELKNRTVYWLKKAEK